METNRSKKFARTIQREISEILQQKINPLFSGLLTVSFVKTTADLGIARIYITFLPENQLNTVLLFMNENKSEIRKMLASRLKNVVRNIPSLEFYEDDTMKVANRLDELFKEI